MASIEDKTARAGSVILAHKKSVLATLTFSAIVDAIKAHYQEKLMEWAIKYLGEPLGTAPSNPYYVGQITPGAEFDADYMPRKRVSEMSADEFSRAITRSSNFRAKIDGTNN